MSVKGELTTVIKPALTLMDHLLAHVWMVSNCPLIAEVAVVRNTIAMANYCYAFCHPSLLVLYTDEDECAVNNGNCTHQCVNTPSSFMCACNEGFSLASDGKTCNGKHHEKPLHSNSTSSTVFLTPRCG